LLRLDALAPTLDGLGVQLRGLSADTPDLVIYLRARDGLGLTVYADPELDAITTLGLWHLGGQVFRTVRLLGVPVGVPWGARRRLPVPTTVLVDAQGIVRWLDVATDYRLRGDDARILAAVRAAQAPLEIE